MKIFWITKLSDNNPFRTSQIEASNGLRNRGHEVTLMLIRNFTEKKDNTKEIMYIPTIDKPILSGLVFGFLLLFYYPIYMKKQKLDVIIVDGDQIFSPFVFSLRLMGIPIIWDIRSLPIDRKNSILHDISFFLTRFFADALTTITPDLKNFLCNKYNLHDKKIGIWSSGVSIQNFKTQKIQKHDFIKKEKNNFILMHHGTYSPTRGIEELIQSIGEIDKSVIKNVKLLLVGIPNEKKDDLIELSKQLNVEDQLEIIPPVDQKEIPSYIQSADVGIIPLPPENEWWKVSVPLKTLEYLAMSKPIIVTDIPFHKKIMNECKCGVLLHTAKPKDISNAIAYLYQKKDKLARMGENGRSLIERDYTWDSIALEIESFINNVLVKK